MKISDIPSSVLDANRQVLGVEPEDTSKDAIIERSGARDLIERYAQWWLGDRSWGSTFYQHVTHLNACEHRTE